MDLLNSHFRIRPRFCILSGSNVLLISEGRGMVHLWWWLKAGADNQAVVSVGTLYCSLGEWECLCTAAKLDFQVNNTHGAGQKTLHCEFMS